MGCGPEADPTWNQREIGRRVEEFGHIAEAYAVVDSCVPMIDADPDAKHTLVSSVGVRSFSSLKRINTEAELGRFLAHHQSQGGSPEQHAQLERAYRAAYEKAQPQLSSLDSCLETVQDFVNTILHTKAPVSR